MPVEEFNSLATHKLADHLPYIRTCYEAADPLKAFGSVLWKALRSLKGGQGIIPILVALQ